MGTDSISEKEFNQKINTVTAVRVWNLVSRALSGYVELNLFVSTWKPSRKPAHMGPASYEKSRSIHRHIYFLWFPIWHYILLCSLTFAKMHSHARIPDSHANLYQFLFQATYYHYTASYLLLWNKILTNNLVGKRADWRTFKTISYTTVLILEMRGELYQW